MLNLEVGLLSIAVGRDCDALACFSWTFFVQRVFQPVMVSYGQNGPNLVVQRNCKDMKSTTHFGLLSIIDLVLEKIKGIVCGAAVQYLGKAFTDSSSLTRGKILMVFGGDV